MLETLKTYLTFEVVLRVLLIPAVATIFLALFRTKTFIDWLDHVLLNGTPRVIPKSEIDYFNNYFSNEEIRINKILTTHPKLLFKKYQLCSEVFNHINDEIADKFREKQFADGLPDDPHAFVFSELNADTIQEGEEQELGSFVIPRYSQLRSLPRAIKDRILVLGANNLVISANGNELILHKRGEVAETEKHTLHGFGGGYMPYWEGGNKSLAVRRDDCKSLRFTAMRELHEESGLLSLDHVPGFVCAIEERHIKHPDPAGKFGYFTFFYVTKMSSIFKQAFKGDPREGVRTSVSISAKNLNSMIIHKKLDNMKIHSQLRSMLVVWFFAGCPGLHFTDRIRLSNIYTRKKLLKQLSN